MVVGLHMEPRQGFSGVAPGQGGRVAERGKVEWGVAGRPQGKETD